MSLYFMRHGQCEGNVVDVYVGQADSPLTAVGRKQAMDALPAIRQLGISRIVASTLSRAVETAEIVAQDLTLQISTDSRLLELDAGSLTGTPIHPRISLKQFLGSEGVEQPEAFAARIIACIQDYAVMPGNTLLVAHAGISRLVYTIEHGLAYNQFKEAPAIDNAAIIEIHTEHFLST